MRQNLLPTPHPMRALQRAAVAATVLALATAVQAQSRGLTAPPDALGGPVWQARFERDSNALPLRHLATWLAPTSTPQSLRLLGDYQFSTLRLGETGGLRLTGGLLLNLRPSTAGLPASTALSAQPYAGVGYASGSSDGRWGFSADLGLAGYDRNGLRLDRPAGAPGADGNARLGPVLRLGMTLAF